MMTIKKLTEYEKLFESMEEAEEYMEDNDILEYRIEPIEYGKAYGLLPKDKSKSKTEAEEYLFYPLVDDESS